MKAYLNKSFKKGFMLSEENVIKINDIIIKRISEKSITEKPQYRIIRKDSLVFITDKYEDLLKEENSARNSIVSLEVKINTEALDFILSFDQKTECNLKIEAKDKDFAYLLFSDIKEYLSTEVLKFRSFSLSESKFVDRLLMPITIMATLIILPFIYKSKYDNSRYLDVLRGSVELKLNYLVEMEQNRSLLGSGGSLIVIGIMVGLAVLVMLGIPAFEKLYPRNIFYLGKEISRYDRICNFRNKFYWVVFIGSIVSIIAGIIVYYTTK